MDLAKIIGELRVELQCLDTAIASMEELARVQSLSDFANRPAGSSGPDPQPEPSVDEALPVKRRRGRPRKDSGAASTESPQPEAPATESEPPA